jgi:hypothetical protein
MLFIPACNYQSDNASINPQTRPVENTTAPAGHARVYTMKGVGIDLPQSDFENMSKAGITIIATEWGMEAGVQKTRAFLDQAEKAGLKVVMDGGFSFTAWGFTEDDWDSLPRGKHPVWQKEKVQTWVKALKDHPAVYAWDISNEFGENLPSGAGMQGSDWPKGRLTTEQLMQARADVLAVDPVRPIHVRTYGWDIDKMQPHIKAMLNGRIADIISLNLYSNYLAEGKLQWPDVVQDAGQYYVENIKKLSPGTVVWLSVAAFEYTDLFQRPTLAGLNRDLKYATLIKGLDGISFFCWGPVNQWDQKGDWYLPKTGADIWDIIKRYMKNPGQFVL